MADEPTPEQINEAVDAANAEEAAPEEAPQVEETTSTEETTPETAAEEAASYGYATMEDGSVVPLSREEDRQYLINLGAKALSEAKRQAAEEEAAAQEAPVPEGETNDLPAGVTEEQVRKIVEERAAKIEQARESEKLEAQIESALDKSELISGLADKEDRTDRRNHVIGAMIEGKSLEAAVKAEEEKISRVVGDARKTAILRKLQAKANATEPAGGSLPGPKRKFNAESLNDGSIDKAVQEYLSSTES